MTWYEGEEVLVTIRARIDCVSNNGIRNALRIDSLEKGSGHTWVYPGDPRVTIEAVEDIQPGDVYLDAHGDPFQRTADNKHWMMPGLSGVFADDYAVRPLKLLHRRGTLGKDAD